MNIDPLIKQFLLEWAEDEFWVGHLMAKKVYDYGPDLEENIAIGSISQDEMGHCRMLLRSIIESKSEKEMDHPQACPCTVQPRCRPCRS